MMNLLIGIHIWYFQLLKNKLYSASNDGSVRIWDASQLKEGDLEIGDEEKENHK